MDPKEKALWEDRLFKLKLVMDETLTFPCEYLFKFIVPVSEVHQVTLILQGMDMDERASSNGKYISVSGKKSFNNSDEIITIYKKASGIKGIISL